MNDMISLITIYLGLRLMSNSSHQDAKRRRDTLAMVSLEDFQKKGFLIFETQIMFQLTRKNTNANIQ